MSRQNLIAVLTASFFCMPVALSSFAQNTHASGTPGQTSEAQQTSRDMRATQLIGRKIKNANGENLGELQDLIVDVAAERIHYAVLSFAGSSEPGEKLFSFPISAFKPAPDRDELVLNVDKEKMKNAPGFARKHWPDWSDNRHRREVDRYFSANAGAAASAGERLMRASDLIGKHVDDRYGRDAGEIKDLVVNPGNERLRYVVLNFDKAWNPDDKLVALPLNALAFRAGHDRDLVLNVERDRINTARGFDRNEWPDLNAPAYRREMDAYLSRFKTEKLARPQRSNTDRETSSGASR